MGSTLDKKVTMGSVVTGNAIYQSRTGQLFTVESKNIRLGTITVRALTALKGAGSAKALPKDETRTLVNGAQWCSNVLRYLPSAGEIYK